MDEIISKGSALVRYVEGEMFGETSNMAGETPALPETAEPAIFRAFQSKTAFSVRRDAHRWRMDFLNSWGEDVSIEDN